MDYKDSQKQKVENLIKNTAYFYDDTGNGNYNVNVTHPYLLKNAENNLYQSIRAQVFKYFSENKIAWWGGKLTNNTLSSQVACLNHLFPIRHDKNAVLSIMKKSNLI